MNGLHCLGRRKECFSFLSFFSSLLFSFVFFETVAWCCATLSRTCAWILILAAHVHVSTSIPLHTGVKFVWVMSAAQCSLSPVECWLKNKTLVSRENKEQSPSHLEELITVVAEAPTTSQPVSSHLQVSIEHTPYQNKWPGWYYLQTVISVVWSSKWCRLVKCWKSLIAMKVLLMYTYKVFITF